MREKSRPNVASLGPGGFLEDGRSEEQLNKNLCFKPLAITKLTGNAGEHHSIKSFFSGCMLTGNL